MFGIAWASSPSPSWSLPAKASATASRKSGNVWQRRHDRFAGRTSMQAGANVQAVSVRWLEDDYIQVAKESPACKYVMPELGTTLRFAASSIAARFPSSAPCRNFKDSQCRHTRRPFLHDQDNEELATSPFLAATQKNNSRERQRSARTSG